MANIIDNIRNIVFLSTFRLHQPVQLRDSLDMLQRRLHPPSNIVPRLIVGILDISHFSSTKTTCVFPS
jgi:hypothetical protein